MRAAEDPRVRAEIAAALATRWGRSRSALSAASADQAPILAGMFAANATEAEVAAYVTSLEREADPAAAPDLAFAAHLLRIALRLDDPAVRSTTS